MTESQDHDDEGVLEIRAKKLKTLREQGFTFPNEFRRTDTAGYLSHTHGETSHESLASLNVIVKVSGRIMLKRIMGKAAFFQLQDESGIIQIYLRKNELEDVFDAFCEWDLGDIVGVSGKLFRTKTNELSIHAETLELLTKSLRPPPDKFHGLTDREMRYRKRYVDLLSNDETRRLFKMRSQLISALREFMEKEHFLEVETPMMHPIPGGAIARPFITHHNTLDMQLFLRIAPELYLKRLLVGGFERVFEINRNFRNEGISTRHNPEFTMIEFYEAYVDYHHFMTFTEKLFHHLCDKVMGTREINYQGQIIDFNKPFARLSVKESILLYHPELTKETLENREAMKEILLSKKLPVNAKDSLAKCQMTLFEETVEHLLIQPVFITEYPTEVSPLARANKENPEITDRFELFIAGREIANGFSELNDPEDQARRFQKQVEERDAGDTEAMYFDSDYIEALEYGMPPAAGEGIGIDRLVMLFTDSPSIRDVILFPQLKL